ncbi:MAG: MG2 domain-containing protein [Anaerolineae bacterium]
MKKNFSIILLFALFLTIACQPQTLTQGVESTATLPQSTSETALSEPSVTETPNPTWTPLPTETPLPTLTPTAEAILEPMVEGELKPTIRAVAYKSVPYISSIQPTAKNITNSLPKIVIRFDQPMDEKSVLDALSLEPEFQYETTWTGRQLAIQATEPWQFDTDYVVRIKDSATNELGTAISQAKERTYRLAEPINTVTYPRSHSMSQKLTFKWNYKIDLDELTADFVTLTPEVEGEWVWDNGHKSLSFVRSGHFALNAKYKVEFSGQFFDQNGLELPQPEAIDFISPGALLRASPTNSTNIRKHVITIGFDRPMDQASAEAAFEISPDVPGSFSWDDNQMTFRPTRGTFGYHQKVSYTLNPTVKTESGELALEKAQTWDFTTAYFMPDADFGAGPNAQVLDANGGRSLQYRNLSGDAQEVSFNLYALTQSQFITEYIQNYAETYRYYSMSPSFELSTKQAPAYQWNAEMNEAEEWLRAQETFVPADVPAGLYIAEIVINDASNSMIFLAITANNITVKTAEGQITAWVNDIHGKAVTQARTTLIDREGGVMGVAQTDENGVAKITIPNLSNDAAETPIPFPKLIISEANGDITISGIDSEWRADGWYGAQIENRDQFVVYGYTERPIYKPGQTVYFKGIIRQDDDAVLDIVPTGTEVTARIRDARENIVQTFEFTTNDFGSVNGSFDIAAGAMTGEYEVEFQIDGEEHSQIFKVEDYRKPEYEVIVSTNREAYVNGENVELTVQADYFIGEPVPNGKVTVKQFFLTTPYYWQNIDAEYIWEQDYQFEERNLTLDSEGQVTLSVLAEKDRYSNYYDGSSLQFHKVGLEVTVNDGSNQPVSSFTVIDVYNAEAGLKIERDSYFYNVDEPIQLAISANQFDGQAMPFQTVNITTRRWNGSERQYNDIQQNLSVKTDKDGKVVYTIEGAEPGYMQIWAKGKDTKGNEMQFRMGLYVLNPNSTWSSWFSRGRALEISADKESYLPGETAILFIDSQFDGPALLTVERGTVRREIPVMLTQPLTQVELPIIETDAPNIFVTINSYREVAPFDITNNGYDSVREAQFYQGTVALAVSADNNKLNVEIIPDQDTYGPGDEAGFTVKVTNQQGVPVSAELSLALVDDAIFALSDELSGPIFDTFYRKRKHAIHNFYSLAPTRFLGGDGGQGGGGGGGVEAFGGPRSDFQDTAVWLPALETDFNGEVRVTVSLPDNLTRWRMTGVATTSDTQVGEAISTIITTQSVQIRPILPRIVTTGDTVQLSALVHNYTDGTQRLRISLVENGEARLDLGDEGEQEVVLKSGEVQIVGWTATIESAGELELQYSAHTTDDVLVDAIILPLTAQPLAIPNVEIEVGEFAEQLATTAQLPADALEMSTVTLELSRSIAGSILQGLDDLTGYPYGCVEQTMSRALPNAVVGRALNQLGINDPTLEAELPKLIGASTQRLYGFQHNDGGWGWWHDDDSQDYQTAWVVFGLANIVEAGYEIDPAVLKRGSNWMTENMDGMDERTRAFALYSQALAGHGDLESTQAAAADLESLDTFAISALALALHELDDRAGALALLDEIADQAEKDEAGNVFFVGNTNDGSYRRKTMASTTRNTGLALSAFAQITPGHPLELGMVRYLMAKKKGFGWGTTNETSFAILGLTDHLLASGFSENGAPVEYTLLVNGQSIDAGQLDAGQPSKKIVISNNDLHSGNNRIVVQQSGARQLFYTLSTRSYVAEDAIEAAGSIKVTRTYKVKEGEDAEEITGSFETGTLVKVTLQVNADDDASYVIIEDQLPAGLEPLNENLNTNSHEGAADTSNRHGYYRWREYGYNQKEIRGNKISFFITDLPAGTRTITYIARVTGIGTVTAMPTEAYAMYDEAFWGRSTSNVLTFEEPPVEEVIEKASEDNSAISDTGDTEAEKLDE